MKLEELYNVWKMSNAYHIACGDWKVEIEILGTKGFIERYKDGRIKSKRICMDSSALSFNKEFQKYKDKEVSLFEVDKYGTSNPNYIMSIILK